MAAPAVLFQTGVHGSRPAVASGCVLYWCTTHNIFYRSDGATWTTLQDLSSIAAGAIPTTAFAGASGDVTPAAGTATDVPGCSFSLATGTWDVDFQMAVAPTGSSVFYIAGVIANAANTILGIGRTTASTLGTANTVMAIGGARLVLGSTTTIKLRAQLGNSEPVKQNDFGVLATWIRALKVA